MPEQVPSFGLIGYPLGHSFSSGHFMRKFEREGLHGYRYQNFAIESISLLPKLIIDETSLLGLNITIPYKQSVMPYLDELDPVAAEIGAVNTIKIDRSGSRPLLTGFNTDAAGFSRSVADWKLSSAVPALVFGTGGSSLAIKYTLTHLGVPFLSVSRKSSEGTLTYEQITPEIAAKHRVWINCTPAGMFPDIHSLLPLPYTVLSPDHYLYDLVYNPEITGFLAMGITAGAQVKNGSVMLVEQAEASWEIWNTPKR